MCHWVLPLGCYGSERCLHQLGPSREKKNRTSAGGIWKGFSVCFSAAWGRVFVQCLVCSQQCLWRGRHFAQVGRKGQVLGLEREGGVTLWVGFCARNLWSRSDYFKYIASFSRIFLSQRCGVAVLACNELVCFVPAALSCSGLLQLRHCWGLRKEKGSQRKEVSCGLCLCCAVSPALLWGLSPSWMFPFVMWSTSPFQNKQAFPPLGKGMWLLLESRAGKCSLTQPLHPLKQIIFLFKQWSNPLSLLYIAAYSVSIFFPCNIICLGIFVRLDVL